MTNIWHSLMKIRPHEPQRNGTPEIDRKNFLLHCCCLWVLSIQTVLRRAARGGRGGDALTATILLSKIGQM